MFDVGFSEMLMVGLIALLVFGPERLPKVAKEAALWVRKARAMASSVKQEIDREMQLQDMKEMLDKQKRDMERMLVAERIEHAALETPKPETPAQPQEGHHHE
ncbi:MAG: Sec-independent protein translocase protein TatB [Candidatus Methylumidiphilus sp.]